MKILVILASYNGGKYIKEQIESILSQTNVVVDLKIYDDRSKDQTAQIIEQFINDGRVSLFINDIATGSAANNFLGAIKGMSDELLSQYDCISFADQDDIWLPEKLVKASQMLQSNNAVLYMSNLIMWQEKTGEKSIINKAYPQKKYDFLFEGGSAGCTYVLTSKFCIDLKQTLEQTDYSNWKFFSHDWFVYFFARINNYKVVIDSNAYILYRIHDSNVHGQLNAFSFFAIKERLKYIKQGWYFEQIKGFILFTKSGSVEKKIYQLYTKNYFSRLYVLLRYNFDLMRSFKKNIQFFAISILPLKINK